MKIIGIDPGLGVTGFGIVSFAQNKYSYIDAGIIKTSTSFDMPSRLFEIHSKLTDILNIHKPDTASIEKTYVNVSADSSLKLAHARSAAILTLKIFKLEVAEYQAKTVKKTLTGTGSADKKQMIQMINYFMPKSKITNPDAADALAIAICHGFYYKRENI